MMDVIAAGPAPYFFADPDEHREYLRAHKRRDLVTKVMDEHEAISRFVADGDYLAYDCNYLQRGPSSLTRELIRQRKRDLWACGKFTYVDLSLLVAAGCVSRADVGYFGRSSTIDAAVDGGALELFEWSNVELTYRLHAGAQGLPFHAVRGFAGTDGFNHSGAKLVQDPFSGKPITLLPSLNPDVAIIHVHECDEFGNARVFGTGIAHVEAALASKKVILSTERIISTEDIRSSPGANTIPYFCVDAVVEARFGAYPGTVPGRYASDGDHIMSMYRALNSGNVSAYLDEWVYGLASHEALLEKVGETRLHELQDAEGSPEGYEA